MSEAVTDEIYYAHAGNLSFLRRISAKAREANYRLFQKVMRPGPETTILDVGVSDEITLESNMLEQRHPHRGRCRELRRAGSRRPRPAARRQAVRPERPDTARTAAHR